jgi:hypothetical protein
MSGVDNERHFPAEPAEVYESTKRALKALRWRLKSADDFARAVTFATPASGFSWGANLSASVVPAAQGAILRIGGTAKVRVNVTAKGAEFKNSARLLDAVSRDLQDRLRA